MGSSPSTRGSRVPSPERRRRWCGRRSCAGSRRRRCAAAFGLRSGRHRAVPHLLGGPAADPGTSAMTREARWWVIPFASPPCRIACAAHRRLRAVVRASSRGGAAHRPISSPRCASSAARVVVVPPPSRHHTVSSVRPWSRRRSPRWHRDSRGRAETHRIAVGRPPTEDVGPRRAGQMPLAAIEGVKPCWTYGPGPRRMGRGRDRPRPGRKRELRCRRVPARRNRASLP